MTAYNPKGSGNGVQEQATKYLYTSTVNASRQTAAVYPDSDDVLSQNGTTKVWTITTDNGDHVATAYDRLGRATSVTDQRGVVHSYVFDSAGRLAHDRVSGLGSSGLVDDAIPRISTTYDDIGRVESVASYHDPDVGEGNVVNEVEYEYNGWGRVSREYEEHDGTVDGSTLFLQYDYADGAAGGVAKYVRLDEVTYPNGREVHYDYGTTAAIDDIMGRLATIGDGSGSYASYKYLGVGRIVVEDYENIDVKLDYAANDFAALDRFGRVLDQLWTDYGEDPDVTLDEYTYTYDRVGNRTGRDNELHSAFDEDYTYDGLNRLTDSDRADAFDQSWTLDGLGNFSALDDDGSSQTRTANAVNEITGITGGWITPSYDDAGNVISGPKPGDEDTRVHYVYDAWNRLVAVKADDSGNPGNTIATYKYDALKRRIEKVVTGGADTHYYYNSDWQLVEARESPISNPQSLTSYVWSPRYVDSPIVRFHDGNGDGDYLDAGDNIRYYTTDGNYNVTATIDAATGGIVERYVYNAYGKATVYSPTWTNPAAPSTDGPLYCGYFFDAESGLYQVRNRYYDSALSTFMSRDPIGYQGGMNVYEYVSDSPVMWTDPTGEGEAADGKAKTAKCFCDDQKRIKEIEARVLPTARGRATCRVKINCQKRCSSGTAGYTPPSIRKDPGSNSWTVTICISTDLDAGSQDTAILHEMIHATQFCERLGGIHNMRLCRQLEGAAYLASCRAAFPGDNTRQGRCRACGLWLGCSRFNNGSSQDVRDPGGCTDADVGITSR